MSKKKKYSISKKKYGRAPKLVFRGRPRYDEVTPDMLDILRDQMAYERIVKEMAELERQKCS